jgi:hypothetical protein
MGGNRWHIVSFKHMIASTKEGTNPIQGQIVCSRGQVKTTGSSVILLILQHPTAI